jgi:chaperonin GroES
MNIKPIGDKVVIKIAPKEEVINQIYIPQTAQEAPNKGTVIEAGPGTPQWPKMQCKWGDEVLYNQFTGTKIEVDGLEYLIISERDILAIL